jgi:hypothetical protein
MSSRQRFFGCSLAACGRRTTLKSRTRVANIDLIKTKRKNEHKKEHKKQRNQNKFGNKQDGERKHTKQ